ncbi:MAG: hypothetical protein K6G86_07800 [Bacteroidales bacterium]|nr:hypothetical protein [Bacteroidales bacterium]
MNERVIKSTYPFTYKGEVAAEKNGCIVEGTVQIAAEETATLISFNGGVKKDGVPVLSFRSFYDQRERKLNFNYSGGADPAEGAAAMQAISETLAAIREELKGTI